MLYLGKQFRMADALLRLAFFHPRTIDDVFSSAFEWTEPPFWEAALEITRRRYLVSGAFERVARRVWDPGEVRFFPIVSRFLPKTIWYWIERPRRE